MKETPIVAFQFYTFFFILLSILNTVLNSQILKLSITLDKVYFIHVYNLIGEGVK